MLVIFHFFPKAAKPAFIIAKFARQESSGGVPCLTSDTQVSTSVKVGEVSEGAVAPEIPVILKKTSYNKFIVKCYILRYYLFSDTVDDI